MDVKRGGEFLSHLELLGSNLLSSDVHHQPHHLQTFVRKGSTHSSIGCHLAVIVHSTDACYIASSLHRASSFLKNEIIVNSGSFYGIIKMSNRIPLGN